MVCGFDPDIERGMKVDLGRLLQYDDIVIQGHDSPDADAIASAYGLYLFFKDKGKKVRMIYGG